MNLKVWKNEIADEKAQTGMVNFWVERCSWLIAEVDRLTKVRVESLSNAISDVDVVNALKAENAELIGELDELRKSIDSKNLTIFGRRQEIEELKGKVLSKSTKCLKLIDEITTLKASLEAKDNAQFITGTLIKSSLARENKALKASLAESLKTNAQLEKDWARCAEGMNKAERDLKCLEESTVDKKAWEQLETQLAEAEKKVEKLQSNALDKLEDEQGYER